MGNRRPIDLPRRALEFGAAGGCKYGCRDCRYIVVCGFETPEEVYQMKVRAMESKGKGK